MVHEHCRTFDEQNEDDDLRRFSAVSPTCIRAVLLHEFTEVITHWMKCERFFYLSSTQVRYQSDIGKLTDHGMGRQEPLALHCCGQNRLYTYVAQDCTALSRSDGPPGEISMTTNLSSLTRIKLFSTLSKCLCFFTAMHFLILRVLADPFIRTCFASARGPWPTGGNTNRPTRIIPHIEVAIIDLSNFDCSGAFASPDVFDRGHMLWPRAIGLDSCFLGLTFLKEVALAKCVIDPFCGVGKQMSNCISPLLPVIMIGNLWELRKFWNFFWLV